MPYTHSGVLHGKHQHLCTACRRLTCKGLQCFLRLALQDSTAAVVADARRPTERGATNPTAAARHATEGLLVPHLGAICTNIGKDLISCWILLILDVDVKFMLEPG